MLFYVSQKAACALELIKISLRLVRSALSVERHVQDLLKPICLCVMTVCLELLMSFINASHPPPASPLFFFCVN